MVEAAPVAGTTTRPLHYSRSQYHDTHMLAVCRYVCGSGLSSNTSSLVIAVVFYLVYLYYITASFPSAGHDLELIDHPVLVLR